MSIQYWSKSAGTWNPTYTQLDKMRVFLKTKASQDIQIILDRERCPQEIPPNKRAEKIEQIRSIASKEKFALMGGPLCI